VSGPFGIAGGLSSGNARRGDTTDFLRLVETYFAFAPSVMFIRMPKIKNLECSRCKENVSAEMPQTLCPKCKGPLYVRYDLQHLRGTAARDAIAPDAAKSPWAGMWRYRAVLPDANPVTLGEGWTPMLRSKRHPGAYLKEEGTNPTGSFKARGLALAVTMARHYGLTKLAVPSAGNAAGALAAYAAAAGIEANIFMPRDVPFANYVEAVAYGANVTLVNGLISDCGRIVAERSKSEGWFDISTLKEPFRVEGKKTMGYELVEQLGWEYPDAVFYPTGGGVGLIGMWKAFGELEELGWIRPGKRPKMIAVQSSGCAPVARAFEEGASASEMWSNAATFASGLRVPKPYGDSIMLEILRESEGVALAIPDAEILASLLDWAKNGGIFLSPEGAAATAAYDRLLASGFLEPSDRVVLFNTGAGLKYTDVTAEAMHLQRP
jgi:threonine synthase